MATTVTGETGPKTNQNPQVQEAFEWIQKRLELVLTKNPNGPLQFDLDRTAVGDNKALDAIWSDAQLQQQLASQLATLDLKMSKAKQQEDPNKEVLHFWSGREEEEEGSQEEGEERFEVPPEEEEAEEESNRRQQGQYGQRGGRGGRGSARGRRARAGQRERPGPLPEQLQLVFDAGDIKSFAQVFKNITVHRIVYENWIRKRLVLVGKNQPLERALSRINTHNIHSLPVVDEDSSVGAVIGLLDVLDMIAEISESAEGSPNARPRRNTLFTPIHEIMEKPFHRPTNLISTHTSLYDAVHYFAAAPGVQRVMIVNRVIEEGTVVQQTKPEEMVLGLLTQSDLLRFMAENFVWMKKEPIFQKTLQELNLGTRKPITVDQTKLAYQAFMEVHKKGCDGIAVVDSNGKLIANVSASNIKGMTRRNYQLLFRPLTQYLARDRKRGWWQLPLCTTLDTKLENVVLQFVAAKVHQMYICDEEGKPTGEVSLSDVMTQFCDL
jgi:CBS-domain-containing membrane protein